MMADTKRHEKLIIDNRSSRPLYESYCYHPGLRHLTFNYNEFNELREQWNRFLQRFYG